MTRRTAVSALVNLPHALAVAIGVLALCACSTGTLPRSAAISTAAAAGHAAATPAVGTYLTTDVDIAEMICSYDTLPDTPHYLHSAIQLSSWRQSTAHSSIFLLSDLQPFPWAVFHKTRTYADYIAALESLPEDSPAGLWYRRLNEQARAPLLDFQHSADPQQRIVYIYAHLFGYDRDFAIRQGLTPVDEHAYAWPAAGLAGTWPAAFLYDDDGAGPLRPRPSFKQPAARAATANAVYFFMKYFENIGAQVHFSPWREVNGYLDSTRCPDSDRRNCGLDDWQDLYATYAAIVARIADSDLDRSRIALYPSIQLESFGLIDQPCVTRDLVEQTKQFYRHNAASGVPFAIGVSTYPASADGALGLYQRRLHHLLNSLDSKAPVACDADGDGVVARNEGVDPTRPVNSLRIPRATPLVIAETSRPPWLTFQVLDTASVKENERLGATLAAMHLNYSYRASDGTAAYPLEIVAFSLGPNWNLPAYHGKQFWITTAAGTARNWLTPMQPLAGQLLLDTALDPDGDWDNDGVLSIALRDSESTSGSGSASLAEASEAISYSMDNCPYLPNAGQADADRDGIGDDCDNCVNVANYPQEDWDQDGFGNACDPDLNNDGLVQPEVDLAVVQQCQGAPIDCLAHVTFPDLPHGQQLPDLNGRIVLIADVDADEDVDEADIEAWWTLAAQASLRESGLACAGKPVCPDPAEVMLRDGQVVTIPGAAPYPFTCAPPAATASGSSADNT